MSRTGGTGGGGQVVTLACNSMAASGLGYRKPLVGTGWATSLKESSGHVGPPFLAVKLFSRSVGVTIGHKL